MIEYSQIRDVHLEISTLCNAACPLCPRNFQGYDYNDGYPEVNLGLDHARKIFPVDFLQQLTSIRVNGNFGDMVMNPQSADIIQYFRTHNANMLIKISTNGGARNADFWQRLAGLDTEISFCLDGLEDTHHLYRQRTVWSTVIKNASTFINAGGKAIWKLVKFDHNAHQIDQCEALARDLGFAALQVVDYGRNQGPVFDRQGKFTHKIGNYRGATDLATLLNRKQVHESALPSKLVDMRRPKQKISCAAINKQSIYVAANGDVSPCCWTGFFPKTFGSGNYHAAMNSQLKPLISKNNALEYPLPECIKWFHEIQQRWNVASYDQGRLRVCDQNCGS